jgi:uncharacterized protein YqgC (DUF456 family)
MTADIIVWFSAILCFVAGAIFLFVPVVPGTVLAYAGVLIFAIYDGFAHFSPTALVILGVIAGLGTIVDNLLNLVGARAFGASKAGLWGVFIGGIVGGILFFPVGLLIGPFLGALVAELLGGRTRKEALKAGTGAFVGYLAGIAAKTVLWSIIVVWFFIKAA